MPKKKLFTAALILIVFKSFGQVGGNSYEFLNVPPNARMQSLGGTNVTSSGGDVSTFMSNPALLGSEMDKNISFSYLPYYADINLTSSSIALQIPKAGIWGASVALMNYGNFQGYGPAGEDLSGFQANEYMIAVGHSSKKGPFVLGANLKYAGSTIASYRASSVFMDLGGVYQHPQKDFKLGIAIKNVGFPITEYTKESKFNMPFDAQAGVSFKPQFMPFRFSVTLHHLYKFNVSYFDPQNAVNNNVKAPNALDKTLSHFIFATELLITKNFNLRAGFDFLRRKDLRLESHSGAAGLSFGANIKVKYFDLAFGRAYYHLAGGTNSFTLIVNLATPFKKKKTE